ARVKGAPANPMSGVAPSWATSRRTASATNSTAPASSAGIANTSASVATGFPTTGPTPGLISKSIPAASSGTTMSENRMAASTPGRRTGWSVLSTTRSGSRHASNIDISARSPRYSGSDRPACRMNQTGVYGTGSRRQARTSGDRDGPVGSSLLIAGHPDTQG